MTKTKLSLISLAFMAGLGLVALKSRNAAVKSNAAKRPNIIVILADDMGYSDMGYYGGEVHTPNLDHLAQNGLRYRQFYNTSRCCPTRASLLTACTTSRRESEK